MFIWTWFLKLISGFAIWKGPQLGKIIFFSIIAVSLIFGFWKVFLEKKISNIEKYVNCNITQIHPVECPKEPAFELIKLWRLRLFSVR